MKNITKVLFALIFAFVASVANAQELLNDTPDNNTHFGWGSATCGGLIKAVGKPGRVEVILYNVANNKIGVLTAPVHEPDSGFGRLLKFDENCNSLAVTAPFSDECGSVNEGAVFVYDWDGDSFEYGDTLCGTDTGENDEFGRALDFEKGGQYIVVGAYPNDAAYVFRRGDPWVGAKVSGAAVQSGEYAGFCVAIDGDIIVRTSPLKLVDTNPLTFGRGEVIRFTYNAGFSFQPLWQVSQSGSKRFGVGCDKSGADIAFSDPLWGSAATVGSGSGQGRGMVHLYHFNGVDIDIEGFAFQPGTGGEWMEFGDPIALSGNNLMVGARYADIDGVVDAGKVFGLSRVLGVDWDNFEFTLTVPGTQTTLNRAGWGLDVSGGMGIGSSPWVDFDFTDEGWAETRQFETVFVDDFEMGDVLHWSTSVGQ